MRGGAFRGGLILAALLALAEPAWALGPHDKAPGVLAQNTAQQSPSAPDHQGKADADDGRTASPPAYVEPLHPENDRQSSNQEGSGGLDKGFLDEATLAIAVGTLGVLIVQTLVFGLQARRLKQTIDAMKGLGDKQSADMGLSITHAETAAKAAFTSAEVAKQTLIASNRAWIEPIIEKADASLILNKFGASYALKLSFKNTGNSPAVDIRFEGWLVGRKMDNSRGLKQVSPIIPHRSKCAVSRNQTHPGIGNMLFPGEEFPSAQRYTTVELGCSMSGEELDSVSFINNGKRCVVLYAGGVVNYTFVTDKVTHQTSFLYEITFRGASCSFDIGQEIHPADNLNLSGIPEGDGRQAD